MQDKLIDKFENDPRYVDIGDLPTGAATYDFDRLYMRQFILEDLQLLHHGMTTKTRPHQHIIRAVQLTCSQDISRLTDGDFLYIMAWLRKQSFPDFPIQAQYICHNPVYVNVKNNIGQFPDAKTAAKEGYRLQPCGASNKILVRQNKVKIYTLEDDDLVIKHPDIDFARVETLTDYHEYIEANPRDKYVADLARWVKKGKTFKAKLTYLMAQKDFTLFDEIERTKTKYFHGVTENIQLVCGQCNHTRWHESNPSLLSFFSDNTDKDIYNMSYNLMSQFGAAPDLKLPARMFIYHHSTLVADRRDAENKAKQAREQRGGRRV
jgi:hypothetical protein